MSRPVNLGEVFAVTKVESRLLHAANVLHWVLCHVLYAQYVNHWLSLVIGQKFS